MFGVHFKAAFDGLFRVLRVQRTFQIHFLFTLLVILAAFYFKFSPTEWLVLMLTISIVLTAEVFNTGIETFADSVTMKHNQNIRLLKDVSAGAVLLSAIISVVIGIMLFYPKILILLK